MVTRGCKAGYLYLRMSHVTKNKPTKTCLGVGPKALTDFSPQVVFARARQARDKDAPPSPPTPPRFRHAEESFHRVNATPVQTVRGEVGSRAHPKPRR